mmetsp:Transcript_96654/g.171915  ORF Transcript_96654/g.171915 Transcript_96654/m.171915 type:complete len:325 (-) Transcript_96654:139-1113(-)|eukprot:CAMPEP_0197630110 /NCGR_PEP_ID=MMETSP1338-20131121/7701_1 /TAXON_ID=43686 ORGANISM="Pelagodinium beii, Strain RCC1491" /NCGR_SAMPLE_ID=MMETSP1338 /ASSEMBLY_ACC=CAM_ASM_000754 /LENGTH=324 /DNA_ID=CAMNT_0043201257 /DNA_START=45 /DNA_END=1019 /DNA_ORIENTATION=+
MVIVTVNFTFEQQRWSHDFEVDKNSSIAQVKDAMLKPKGTQQDLDSFELQLLGRRVPDFEQVTEDCAFDFLYLGVNQGTEKAQIDRQDEARWGELQKPQHEAATRATGSRSSPAPEPKKEEAFYTAKPAPRPAGATGKGTASLAKRWEVVGGSDKGGILVREGQSTSSKQLQDRLSTGAVVQQLAVHGERLNYLRLSGTGPETGWVSLTISGKELLVEKKPSADEMLTLEQALSLQEDLMAGYGRTDFQQALAQIIQEHPEKSGHLFHKKRNDLFLTVQSVVLPRYGFEGTPKGVMQMMQAYGPHGQVPEVAWNNSELNKLLQF